MVLARDENRLRRIDVVCRGEIRLVQGKAGSSSGIDVEQWLFERHVAESFDERHFDFFSGNRNFHLVAVLVAELHKIFGADVGDDVSVGTVEGDRFARQTFVVDDSGLQVETD